MLRRSSAFVVRQETRELDNPKPEVNISRRIPVSPPVSSPTTQAATTTTVTPTSSVGVTQTERTLTTPRPSPATNEPVEAREPVSAAGKPSDDDGDNSGSGVNDSNSDGENFSTAITDSRAEVNPNESSTEAELANLTVADVRSLSRYSAHCL